jgi:hypothetical protein
MPDVQAVVEEWMLLKHDYISDLQLRITPYYSKMGEYWVMVEVCSQRYDEYRPEGYDYVWAARHFDGSGYSISWERLFDLLIDAHQEIARVFARLDA